MPLPRFRLRTLMIAVAVVGMECAIAAYAMNRYELGPRGSTPAAPVDWRWIIRLFLIFNVLLSPLAIYLWMIWRNRKRFFPSRCRDDATRDSLQ